MVDTHSKMLSPLGPAEQLHGGSSEISASSFWMRLDADDAMAECGVGGACARRSNSRPLKKRGWPWVGGRRRARQDFCFFFLSARVCRGVQPRCAPPPAAAAPAGARAPPRQPRRIARRGASARAGWGGRGVWARGKAWRHRAGIAAQKRCVGGGARVRPPRGARWAAVAVNRATLAGRGGRGGSKGTHLHKRRGGANRKMRGVNGCFFCQVHTAPALVFTDAKHALSHRGRHAGRCITRRRRAGCPVGR